MLRKKVANNSGKKRIIDPWQGPGGRGGLRNLNYLKLYEATKKPQKVEKRGRVLRKAQLLYEKHDYNVCKRYF